MHWTKTIVSHQNKNECSDERIQGLIGLFFSLKSMVRVQKRIFDGLEVLQFFTTRQWDFRTERFFGLYRELSVRDQQMYVKSFSELIKVNVY